MKLILEAIKALFRKVWAKLSDMETSINDKVSALEAAVTAFTPMVVNITGKGENAPVVDKPFIEILTHLQNGGRVETFLSGYWMLHGLNAYVENKLLQIASYNKNSISMGYCSPYSGGIETWSLELTPDILYVAYNRIDADSTNFQEFPYD